MKGTALQKPGLEYRADIDGLRALAVTVVVLFHLDVSWLPGGFVGVDVFFVISGFLITSLIQRRIEAGTFSLVDFYERRFRRIYPNLMIVLAATAALGWFTMMLETYRFFGRSLVWAALSASNFAFMGKRGYFDPGSMEKPLLHTWSLGVEEQFYLVFPWLLMLAAKRGYRTSWLISGSVALSLVLSIIAGLESWPSSYFLLPTRFWELGIGGLIAVLPATDLITPARRLILGLAGLAAVLWACLFLSESDSFPGYLALAPVLGAAALIVASDSPINRLMALPPFAWIGRISYALYLWHWPLITIAAGIGFSIKDTATRATIILLALALSFAGYHLWEIPIRRRQMLVSRRALFTAVSAGVLLLVGTGIWIFTGKGLPQRLPKEISQTYETTKKNNLLILKRCPDEGPTTSCTVGREDSNDVSFIIVGDSHSQSIAAEIGDIAAQYGLRGLLLGKSACKLFAKPPTEQDLSCIPQNNFMINQYKKYRPKLVLAIVRWPIFLNHGNPGIESNSWYKVFDKTLEDWSKSTVVTSIAIPMYDTDISEVGTRSWLRSRIWLSALPIPEMPLEEYRHRQADTQELLDAEMAKHPNLRIVDPATVFCPQGRCISIADGKPLYFDNNHPSHEGALLYASLFRPYLKELAERLAEDAPATKAGTTAVPSFSSSK